MGLARYGRRLGSNQHLNITMKKLIILIALLGLALPCFAQTLKVSTVELTRPSDTTAYAAKDAVTNSTTAPTVLTFSNLTKRTGSEGYIVKARLLTDQSTNTARFRLNLYKTAPTAINDNSPHTMLYTNAANRIGYIDFAAASTEGTGSTGAGALNAEIRLPFTSGSATAIYGMLETLDAFTPASGQKFYIELTADVY